MTAHVRWHAVAAVTSSAMIGAVFLSGASHAITDTIFRYSTPQTGYLAIPAAAFVAWGPVPYFNIGFSVGPETTNNTCFVAPIHLPNRARMISLAIWYSKRADVGTDYSVKLERQKLSDGTVTELVSRGVPRTGPSRRAVTSGLAEGAAQIVDNRRHVYYMTVCMNDPLNRLFGARLTYTYRTAGD